MDSLVSTEWLADELGAADLRIADASYFALDPSRDPLADYRAAHIPGAVYLDLGNLADPGDPLPSMLPPAGMFAGRMQALGIGKGDRIILYDDTPHHTSARAWWMLRTFGAAHMAILDGGLAKWRAEGRAIASGTETPQPRPFAAVKSEAAVRSLAQMQANLASGAERVLDARSAARFTGDEADPRGLAAGHIPGSQNLPYGELFEADGTWKRGAALKAAFDAAGVDLACPLVTTCGSGITAAVLLFGAHLLGKTDVALYDGSWSEWGLLPETPKAVGPA